MIQLGSPINDQQVHNIINSLDIDQNGQVEWSEFASLMADRWIRQDGATDLAMAGQLFEAKGVDGERQGFIDMAFLREQLCTVGESPLTDAEFDQLAKMGDPDNTGRISVEVFMQLPCWQAPKVSTSELRSPRRQTSPRPGSSSSSDSG